MAGTLVAIFPDRHKAAAAASALLENGAQFSDISLVTKGAPGETGSHAASGTSSDVEEEEDTVSHGFREVAVHDVEEPYGRASESAPRAAVGLVAGSSLGVLAVAFTLSVPGLGLIMAAGPLFALMAGGVGGGIVGGLIGAMTADGIPEGSAQLYHDHVDAGEALVTVLASRSLSDRLRPILEQHGGTRVAFFERLIDTMQAIES